MIKPNVHFVNRLMPTCPVFELHEVDEIGAMPAEGGHNDKPCLFIKCNEREGLYELALFNRSANALGV